MKWWSLLFAFGIAVSFGACGGKEATTGGPLQEKQGTPAPIIEARPSWSVFAEARGMPDFEPTTPLRHYRMTGVAVFFQADREIQQEAELWLAAPDRMRFRLGAEGEASNIFLLADFESSWVRTPTTEYQDYPSLDLWKETLIRWHVLRFPWGWEDSVGTEEGLQRDFLLDTKLGILTLTTDESGLPHQVHLRENNLSLGAWKASEGNGFLVPTRWDWTSELGRREETYNDVRGGALYLDSGFRPDKIADVELARRDVGDVEMRGDSFDVLELELQFLTEEAWEAGSDWAKGRWWSYEGERVYLYSVGIGPQEQAHRLQKHTYLWWSIRQDVEEAIAIEQLKNVLPQLGLAQDGAVWMVEQDRGLGFLMPVIPTGQGD